MPAPYQIALVGIGKIARDQHIPTITESDAFTLTAAASRNGRVDGIENFNSLEALLAAKPDVACISLCTPPTARYYDARRAIAAGKHVMLEKPPGATLSEVQDLVVRAQKANVTLFATWHSRYAHAVAEAKTHLVGAEIKAARIIWKEDVRRWHPGQAWIWEPGGMGVLDPGINALSILTHIMPQALRITQATLSFPENRQTPIAVDMTMMTPDGLPVAVEFDWRQEGPQTWTIEVDTVSGPVVLTEGGSRLSINGVEISAGPDREYAGLYARFAALIAAGESDVDLSPFIHVCDAMALGARQIVEPFID